MNEVNKVAFPGLGWSFTLKETAFTLRLFGKELPIQWYALIITLGIILAVAYVILRAAQIKVTSDDIIDYVIYTVPIGILGARLYYVVTSLSDPTVSYDGLWDVLNPRNGGLGIYGGIIFGTVVVAIVSIIKKIPFLAIADCASPALIMAQSIGRWGNFVNAEAYGGVTTLPWRMSGESFASELSKKGLIDSEIANQIIEGTVGVHPTFFYESAWNMIGFILINIFFKHKKYDGQILFMMFGWYGLGRLWIEGLRTDSLMVGVPGMLGMILAIASFVVCYVFVQKIVDAAKSKNINKNHIIIASVTLGLSVVFALAFVLDLTVLHTPAFLRVSQILAGSVFVACLSILIVFAATKYSKPQFIKPESTKKGKKKQNVENN